MARPVLGRPDRARALPGGARVVARRLSRVPVYPVLLVAVFGANLAIANAVAPQAAIRGLVVACVATAALIVVATTALGDRDRGAAAAATIVVILVSTAAPILLLALGAAVGVAVVAWWRSRGPIRWRAVTGIANVVAVLLLATLLVRSTASGGLGRWGSDLGFGTMVARGVAAPGSPDIYLILLDGHPRADTVRSMLGADGDVFVDGLRDRGFRVASQSHSNYSYTIGTLASMFQMRHLDEDPATGTAGPRDGHVRFDQREAIARNPAVDELRRRGYEIISADAGFAGVDIRDVDRKLNSDTVTEFEIALLRSFGMDDLIDAVAPYWATTNAAQRIDHNLAVPARVAAEPAGPSDPPRFVFVHVPAPHPPLAFHADGSIARGRLEKYFIYDPPPGGPSLVERYAENLAVVDARVLAAIDRLDAVPATRDRVVILFSDHGTRLIESTEEEVQEHAANLFAARMPDGSDPYGDRPGTVNLFPILLNRLFEAGIPLRPDLVRVSTFGGHFWTDLPDP